MRVGELLVAAAIGVVAAVGLCLMPVPVTWIGMAPLPRPVSLALAQRFLGETTSPLTANLLQGAYVTVWTVVYALFFRPRYPLTGALLVAGLMWAIMLVLGFPLAGWGFFGLQFGSTPMVTVSVGYALVALLVWGMAQLLLARRASRRFGL